MQTSPTAQPDGQHEQMLINLGPRQHSTHGVLRLDVQVDGDTVLEAVPHLGYVHRCQEKIAEQLTYTQFIPYSDRIDYLSAMNNNLAWALAVEKLAGISVPRRAQYIRVLAAELSRIASHLVSFGTFGLDVGSLLSLGHAFEERERLLSLFEALCGARVTHSYICPGGVRWDLPDDFGRKVGEFLDQFEPRLEEFDQLLGYNPAFVRRTAGVGVLTAEVGIAHGVSGPAIRGSGVTLDLRRDQPYDVYDQLELDVCVGTGSVGKVGDCWDRYAVRMAEMKQSVRLARQCLAQMPDGPFRQDPLPDLGAIEGEAYAEAENPRGRLGFYVLGSGGPAPARVRIRTPSFSNLSVLPTLCRGARLTDLAVIVGSLDIVMAEVDR